MTQHRIGHGDIVQGEKLGAGGELGVGGDQLGQIGANLDGIVAGRFGQQLVEGGHVAAGPAALAELFGDLAQQLPAAFAAGLAGKFRQFGEAGNGHCRAVILKNAGTFMRVCRGQFRAGANGKTASVNPL